MALQKLTGAKGAAMDNSAAMLAYAEQLAGKAGAKLQLVDGDMQSFELEVGSGQQSQASDCVAERAHCCGRPMACSLGASVRSQGLHALLCKPRHT